MLLNKNIFFLFFLSLSIFLSKWIFSFSFFHEALDVKIIFESVTDGKYYYPLVKYLAEFNFNNSYDPAIANLKIVPLPVAGIFFHSLFYKIFGIISFIFIEFFCIFLFLLIFKKIFSYFFSDNVSIMLALFMFILPSLVSLLNLQNLAFIGLLENNFYTLRVPRPMISALYFFTFICLIVSMYMREFYEKKKFIYLGVIFGLTLSSFYYYFFIEVITFFILIIIKFKNNFLKEIYKNFRLYGLLLLSFILIISPFLINLFLHEGDFTSRQCVYELDFSRKLILIKHYLISYLNLKFLFMFIIMSMLTLFANKIKINNYKMLNVFFIIFVSSILAPILFVTLSNKSCVLYHFNNLIIVWGIIFFIIFVMIIFYNLIKKDINNVQINLMIIIFISIYSLSSFVKINDYSKNDNKNTYRKEFQQVTSLIKNNFELSNTSILTFDNDLMIWSILNNVRYLNLVNGLFISKTDKMIEDDLINAFKFFDLDSDIFMEYLENKKNSWRYVNLEVSNFFFYKYQANSLKTFKDSVDFDPQVLSLIIKSSPILHQQSIIPNFELDRLKNKFLISNLNNFNEPDIIVLNKDKRIFDKIIIDKNKYCNVLNGKKFSVYFYKANCSYN